MKNYKIADLSIDMQCFGETLTVQSLSYLSNKAQKADISIKSTLLKKIIPIGNERKIQNNTLFTKDEVYNHIYVREDNIFKLHIAADLKGTDVVLEFCVRISKYPNISIDQWEYIQTGFAFSRALLEYDGFCFHSSAVGIDNMAVLFSGPCGVGKSTQAGLWQKYFGKDKAVIINDDKPAIRLIDDRFYVYGSPWSGKSGLNLNIKVPLQAIIFLNQAKENHIRRLSDKEAIQMLIYQSLRPNSDSNKMGRLLTLLDALLKETPVYRMDCNMSTDGAKLAYTVVNNERMK